jgi:hypothetical protein
MPDLTPDQVRAQLAALGLAPQSGDDLAEVTHRINAVNEALTALEPPDLDAAEPLTIFDFEEATP